MSTPNRTPETADTKADHQSGHPGQNDTERTTGKRPPDQPQALPLLQVQPAAEAAHAGRTRPRQQASNDNSSSTTGQGRAVGSPQLGKPAPECRDAPPESTNSPTQIANGHRSSRLPLGKPAAMAETLRRGPHAKVPSANLPQWQRRSGNSRTKNPPRQTRRNGGDAPAGPTLSNRTQPTKPKAHRIRSLPLGKPAREVHKGSSAETLREKPQQRATFGGRNPIDTRSSARAHRHGPATTIANDHRAQLPRGNRTPECTQHLARSTPQPHDGSPHRLANRLRDVHPN
jgi:hypothetical protein